ncbi:unnamed protein product, partial [Ceratitis capitata]
FFRIRGTASAPFLDLCISIIQKPRNHSEVEHQNLQREFKPYSHVADVTGSLVNNGLCNQPAQSI